MSIFILLNLAIPFLVLEVTEQDGEKVKINVPKTLIEESIEFAKACDGDWDTDCEIDNKKIPTVLLKSYKKRKSMMNR